MSDFGGDLTAVLHVERLGLDVLAHDFVAVLRFERVMRDP